MNRLEQRDFLKEIDFTPEDLTYLLNLAAELKAAKKARREPKFMRDKNIVILFEKDSTRTRCSFEVAAHDLWPTRPACCHVFLTASNTGAMSRAAWKLWPNTPPCRSGTA